MILRYAHLRYAKCLFTNIPNQWNTIKSSLLFKKNTNLTVIKIIISVTFRIFLNQYSKVLKYRLI